MVYGSRVASLLVCAQVNKRFGQFFVYKLEFNANLKT